MEQVVNSRQENVIHRPLVGYPGLIDRVSESVAKLKGQDAVTGAVYDQGIAIIHSV